MGAIHAPCVRSWCMVQWLKKVSAGPSPTGPSVDSAQRSSSVTAAPPGDAPQTLPASCRRASFAASSSWQLFSNAHAWTVSLPNGAAPFRSRTCGRVASRTRSCNKRLRRIRRAEVRAGGRMRNSGCRVGAPTVGCHAGLPIALWISEWRNLVRADAASAVMPPPVGRASHASSSLPAAGGPASGTNG
eukprot:3275058-Rhodomonas_salina.1